MIDMKNDGIVKTANYNFILRYVKMEQKMKLETKSFCNVIIYLVHNDKL